MNNDQRDIRWINTPLGDGSTTIGISGCTVSVIGDILGVTPDVVNKRLQEVKGFSGALVIWAKIQEAFPGITVRRVWAYNNDDVLVNVPNVIVEVPAAPIGGIGSHWVNYIGNHQLKDPWTGTIRPTADFPNPTGYAVITGKFQGGGSVNDNIIRKSSFFDQIWLHRFGAQTNTDQATQQQVTDFNAWLDSNVHRAGAFDQICLALGLGGDSNQVTVAQVLGKITDPTASKKLAQIKQIVNG